MVLIRALGWSLLAAAVAALVNDCLTWWAEGTFSLLSLGELWSRLDYGSLHGTQVLLERHVSAGLWQHGLRPILEVPALPILAMVGVVLVWSGGRPRGARSSSGGGATVGSRPPRRRRGRGLS